MHTFTYDQPASRVVFGAGSRSSLPREVERLQVRRVLVLSSAGRQRMAEELSGSLGAAAAGVFAEAVTHVPLAVAEAGRREARRVEADALIAVGGGSATGLAKAIALESGLPILAVPTTYSGSEMTGIWGLTEAGVKRTGRDDRVRPRTVIYDPELTVALPPPLAGPSGMNAVAHCVEALYAPDANPLASLMAEEGIRALGAALPRVVRRPDDLDARADALYGAWLAGAALGSVAMSLHHKLCHTLGGSFGLPHAAVHTVVLPHTAAYNRLAAGDAMARVARALGSDDAPAALFDLAASLGAPTALRDLGMAESDLDRAADLAMQTPYANPRPVEGDAIRALLEGAYHGRRPVRGEAP